MSSGWAAPESGPARERYLRENGEAFLHGARAAISAVIAVLGDQKIPAVVLTGNEAEDLAYVNAVCDRWAQLREKYSGVLEAKLRGPIDAAVRNAMDALNFLEDTELCDTAHALVHQAAMLRFGFLGCRIWSEDGEAQTDCPVRIAHQRWGLSPELVTEWTCSICGQRFDSCAHLPGDEYEVVVDRAGNYCSACLQGDCAHQHGETVTTAAHQVAASIEALAIAVVARPRDPRARIVALPIELPHGSEIHEQVQAGKGLCRECILPCRGFVQPDQLR